jgi:hypothetical protein
VDQISGHVKVVPNPSVSFVLLDTGMTDARVHLQQKGLRCGVA